MCGHPKNEPGSIATINKLCTFTHIPFTHPSIKETYFVLRCIERGGAILEDLNNIEL
jgi:hypothetical protein